MRQRLTPIRPSSFGWLCFVPCSVKQQHGEEDTKILKEWLGDLFKSQNVLHEKPAENSYIWSCDFFAALVYIIDFVTLPLILLAYVDEINHTSHTPQWVILQRSLTLSGLGVPLFLGKPHRTLLSSFSMSDRRYCVITQPLSGQLKVSWYRCLSCYESSVTCVITQPLSGQLKVSWYRRLSCYESSVTCGIIQPLSGQLKVSWYRFLSCYESSVTCGVTQPSLSGQPKKVSCYRFLSYNESSVT